MRIQYGDRCVSGTQVYEWTEKFKNGVTSVEDSPRPGPAFTAVTEDNMAAVENVVVSNVRKGITLFKRILFPDGNVVRRYAACPLHAYVKTGFRLPRDTEINIRISQTIL